MLNCRTHSSAWLGKKGTATMFELVEKCFLGGRFGFMASAGFYLAYHFNDANQSRSFFAGFVIRNLHPVFGEVNLFELLNGLGR